MGSAVCGLDRERHRLPPPLLRLLLLCLLRRLLLQHGLLHRERVAHLPLGRLGLLKGRRGGDVEEARLQRVVETEQLTSAMP
jgi:hypothetical protein